MSDNYSSFSHLTRCPPHFEKVILPLTLNHILMYCARVQKSSNYLKIGINLECHFLRERLLTEKPKKLQKEIFRRTLFHPGDVLKTSICLFIQVLLYPSSHPPTYLAINHPSINQLTYLRIQSINLLLEV